MAGWEACRKAYVPNTRTSQNCKRLWMNARFEMCFVCRGVCVWDNVACGECGVCRECGCVS